MNVQSSMAYKIFKNKKVKRSVFVLQNISLQVVNYRSFIVLSIERTGSNNQPFSRKMRALITFISVNIFGYNLVNISL